MEERRLGVNTKISSGKSKIKVRVVPTEIYSRVVGYYRPVQNWNKGKVEEFHERKLINPDGSLEDFI